MITYTFTSQLACALGQLLDAYLNSLKSEIRRTENFDYREQLKQQREFLSEIRTKCFLHQDSYTFEVESVNAQTLFNIVDNAVDDLRVEIRHTDNIRYKEVLKNQQQLIKELLELMRREQTAVAQMI